MIKWYELGTMESHAKNFPNLKATVDMPRYCFVKMDHAAKTVKFAVAADTDESYAVVCQDLWFPMGDPLFWNNEPVIETGNFVHCTMIGSMEGNKIDIDNEHVTDAYTGTTLNIAVGDYLIPDGTGNLAKGSAPTAGWALVVREITYLTQVAFRCQVINVANATAVTP